MSLFNSTNPRIAAAQARTLDTLMAIPEEYGAVFVIDDYQNMKGGELPVAVREHTRQMAMAKAALRLAVLAERKAQKAAVQAVVALDDWRVA